jgi:hypothetical protein
VQAPSQYVVQWCMFRNGVGTTWWPPIATRAAPPRDDCTPLAIFHDRLTA